MHAHLDGRVGRRLIAPRQTGGDALPAHDVTDAHGQGLQQRKLPAGRSTMVLAQLDARFAQAQPQGTDTQLACPAESVPTQQRTNPRLQLLQVEGLGHVVIGAGIQPADAVIDGIARGDDQQRQR